MVRSVIVIFLTLSYLFFAHAGIRHVVRFGTTRVVRRQPDGV